MKNIPYYGLDLQEEDRIITKNEQFEKPAEIELHRHHFYEIAFIQKGACLHSFRGVDAPLIAGDLFLIPEGEAHSYSISSYCEIINCYFFPDKLPYIRKYLKKIENPIPEKNKNSRESAFSISESDYRDQMIQYTNDKFFSQGVLHLSPAAAAEIETYLRRIQLENDYKLEDSDFMKENLLWMILISFRREQLHNNIPTCVEIPGKKAMILNVLTFLETNYASHISLEDMASVASLSVSYFRSVFKEVTGISPLDYLNRYRIVKALEFITRDDLPIGEAATRVGILDAAYFSRLFKKFIGYSPRYFKKVHNH